MIAIESGGGSGLIDGRHYRLRKGGCYLVPPQGEILINPDEGKEVAFIRLELEVKPVAGTRNVEPPQPFPFYGKLEVQPLQEWRELLKELRENSEAVGELAAFRRHVWVQKLLYYLFLRNWQSKNNSAVSVNRLLDKLHGDFADDFSVKQLAAEANLGVRQFTSVFKDMTGLKPLDYIARLRMDKAKQQLLSSSEGLSGIARSVGYQDVYYFSRRFKQIVGESPTRYADRKRNNLRIVALYYSGTVMALGFNPVGANLTWWGGSDYLKERETETVDLGVSPTLEQIASLEPDLILLNDHDRHHYEQLRKIAPSVFIPYDGHRPFYEEARMLGRLLGNAGEAERFIARYERKAAAIRGRLADRGIRTDRLTAGIIRIEGNGTRFSVFGDNYGRGGWSVYRGLRFQPPAKVRQIMDSGAQIALGLPISRLPEYVTEADYLFVVNEGEGIRQVSGQKVWKSLPSVARNRVFELSHRQISYIDPISIEAQLDLLGELLREAGLNHEIKPTD